MSHALLPDRTTTRQGSWSDPSSKKHLGPREILCPHECQMKSRILLSGGVCRRPECGGLARAFVSQPTRWNRHTRANVTRRHCKKYRCLRHRRRKLLLRRSRATTGFAPLSLEGTGRLARVLPAWFYLVEPVEPLMADGPSCLSECSRLLLV